MTLPAHVSVDRRRGRSILIAANLGRALLLALVPLLAALNLVRLPLLAGLAFLVGVLTVFFQLAYQSYLPTLVGREDLVDGNSKLSAACSSTYLPHRSRSSSTRPRSWSRR